MTDSTQIETETTPKISRQLKYQRSHYLGHLARMKHYYDTRGKVIQQERRVLRKELKAHRQMFL